jgi:DNA-directed RNA polymerase beta subunit
VRKCIEEKYIWEMIDLFFKENGLISQQIDSYNRFIQDVSDIVLKEGKFDVSILPQFRPGEEIPETELWQFSFQGPIYKIPPCHMGSDKTVIRVTPMMCRLRDLTYECQIRADLHYRKYRQRGNEDKTLLREGLIRQVGICTLPVMVGSDWCNMKDLSTEERMAMGECPNDPGGYFIVKGC